jgi:hypothetical protein
MTLSPADRERLSKLLGSDHPGERAAAGRRAHRMLQERGIAWSGALAPVLVDCGRQKFLWPTRHRIPAEIAVRVPDGRMA